MKNADRPINPIVQEEYIAGNRVLQCTQAGLTKREYFAGLAMQAADLEKYAETHGNNWAKEVAKDSVIMADELLKALESDQ